MPLHPDSAVSSGDLERAKHHLVRDAAWATLAGSLYGGVVLVGFAVALGARPIVIGLLAAVPFLAQIAQVPAIALVERVRERRKITVLASSLSRAAIMLLAFLPGMEPDRALAMLLIGQTCITLLGSVSACSFNSWMHQLLPTGNLGALFARRLFWSTLVGSLGALFAGQVVQRWPFGDSIHGYAVAFAAAGLAGLASSYHLARTAEPPMPANAAALPVHAMLRAPFFDGNFRRVLVFMASWNFASNLAAPFITVYLITQMALGLGAVTALWMSSQVANALTLYLWGRLSDRLSNKAILAVALPAYFASLVALPFCSMPDPHPLTLPLLFVIHILMGAASGGIGLATGNLGLKLAPQGQGTAYLSAASLAGSLAAGLASILGGALASWLASRELSVSVHWRSGFAEGGGATVLRFQHWEFLFALSFALGGYVLHALSRINEGQQISERQVVQEFVAEARRSIDQLSPVEGLRSAVLFPFGRLSERRRRPRRPTVTPRSAP
jgi:MFS family permease